MARYVLRVFRDNVTGWVPTILVVAVVTTLVGICMNQFVWTSSPSFTLAARQAGLRSGRVRHGVGHDLCGGVITRVLLVDGGRLGHGQPYSRHVRAMAAYGRQPESGACQHVDARGCGEPVRFPDRLSGCSACASLLAVPEFNAMAAESFADGFGSFAPPAFTPSMAAWLGSCCWVWPRACWARPSPRCAQRRSVPSR